MFFISSFYLLYYTLHLMTIKLVLNFHLKRTNVNNNIITEKNNATRIIIINIKFAF